MAASENRDLSTIESIKSTIDTDTHVYRWFLFLILQPSVRTQTTSIEGNSRSYAILKSAMRAQAITGAVFVLLILLGYFLKEPAFFGVSTFLLYPIFRLHMKKKGSVISISGSFLEADPEKSLLTKQTLYKICEHYVRKHKVPSMVDYICFSNRFLRWTLLGGFVLTVVILPFKGLENGLAFLLVYLAGYVFVNSTAVYKFIR